MKIRSTVTTFVGVLALSATSLVHAATGCLRWDFSQPWTAIQDNGYKVEFRLNEERPDFAGRATQSSPRPKPLQPFTAGPETRGVNGTIDGDSIELLTDFGGRYLGTVDVGGRLTGMAIDVGNRAARSRSPWSSDRPMNCLRWRPPVAGSNDFNHDRRADIVWFNEVTHETQIWFMQANHRVGRSTVFGAGKPLLVGTPWRIVGSRDFDRDGVADLLWYNSTTGETQIWFMRWDGTTAQQREALTVVDRNDRAFLVDASEWRIVGTGDMDGDGNNDVVWQDTAGRLQVWRMDRNQVIERKMVIGHDGSQQVILKGNRLAGIHDMDNDGDADLVIYTGLGGVQVFQMNGLKVQRRSTVRSEDGRTPVRIDDLWRITGADDFNRDGFGDIVWHNKITGETQLWKMGWQLVDIQLVPIIKGRFTVDADGDGGGHLVAAPWFQMNH
jgi:hypothetical protein